MAYTNYIYEGAGSSLEPSEFYSGYKIPAGSIGATTSVQTANQVKEVSNLLNQGMKNVEVSMIKQDVFDMISKQQLSEIRRINALTGAEASFHAPIVDPSGFTEQGWEESNRQAVERQFIDTMERAHELNPKGNIPITIHASSVPGTETIPYKNPETGEMEEVSEKMIAVNRETGQLIPLTREKRYYPGQKKEFGAVYTPEEEIIIANGSYWDNKLSQLVFYKERGDEIMQRAMTQFQQLEELKKRKDISEEEKRRYGEALSGGINNDVNNVLIYHQNTRQSLNGLFNEAYKVADDEGKEKLKQVSKQFGERLKDAEKARANHDDRGYIGNQAAALQGLINDMRQMTSQTPPELYKPVEGFIKEKASQTIAGTALAAYNKFGPTAPIISIENPPYGSAVSRAKDLKELVEESRRVFVERARQEGMSESEARNAAEKLIGVTWDTSHIAMMRKQGFESKELTKEAKIVAPFVKHVHLNDNFGSSHVDLPAGMGNVPLGDIMKEINKAGFEGKQVFEGGNFFQHYQTTPHPYMLEAFGGAMPRYGGYFAGYGTVLPDQHFSMYGAGFSGLPTELGGQIQQKGSRMSGTPMA